MRAHVMSHHGCPVEVLLVGHRYMVQRGSFDSPPLPSIDLKHLSMEEEHGEVRVGIGVGL